VLVVSPNFPIKSLKDLINAAKKNHRGITYGSAGIDRRSYQWTLGECGRWQ
jgi:tripartite-type tricarboxylate transporter receptor subunit TctC